MKILLFITSLALANDFDMNCKKLKDNFDGLMVVHRCENVETICYVYNYGQHTHCFKKNIEEKKGKEHESN